jgi:uncharacterized protein YkwD
MGRKLNLVAAVFLMAAGFAFGQSVILKSPHGGESWQLGTFQMITWEPVNYTGNVTILLYKDGVKMGAVAKKISAALKEHKWEVGKHAKGTAAPGSGYKIWICSEDWSFKDISKNPFSLTPASLQMIKAQPPPAGPVLIYKTVPLDQINVKKYPNPAASKLTYKIAKMNNQFSIEELKVIGTVENIGPAEFKYGGTATLYRGSEIAAQKNFGTLYSRQSFQVEFSVRESYDFTSQGLQYPVDYYLKIAFNPGIQAKPEEIDGDMGNNEKKLSGATVAKEAYQTYANGYRQQLTSLINQYRQGKGLNPLALDSCISSAAQGHSEWMAVNKTFNHAGKNGSSHQARCQWAGCACSHENIYNGGMSPSEAFNAWKASPGHNATMLGALAKIGIGICGGWITADFD